MRYGAKIHYILQQDPAFCLASYPVRSRWIIDSGFRKVFEHVHCRRQLRQMPEFRHVFVAPANPLKQGLDIYAGQITGFQLRQPRARFHTNDLGVGDFTLNSFRACPQ